MCDPKVRLRGFREIATNAPHANSVQVRGCRRSGLEVRLPAGIGVVYNAPRLLMASGGRDLRREPIERRKALLAKLLKGAHLSIILNEHFEEDGAIVFREACRIGCEGIVSKWLGSLYRSGRSPNWLKLKNPARAGRQARGRRGLGSLS